MIKGKIIFILGGIKSGKSTFALEQAKKLKTTVSYIATAVITDNEIERRIKIHKQSRPSNWQTIEEPVNLLNALNKIKNKTVILDCINFLVSNLIYNRKSKNYILNHIEQFFNKLKEKKLHCYLISNEVGLSLVSPYKTGRDFQETLGKVNQLVAKHSNEVYFMVAGIPVKIK